MLWNCSEKESTWLSVGFDMEKTHTHCTMCIVQCIYIHMQQMLKTKDPLIFAFVLFLFIKEEMRAKPETKHIKHPMHSQAI